MRTVEVHITDEVAARLEQAACERKVSVEELLRASVEEKLARDAEFDSATRRVLAKNSELYERLS